MFLQGRQNASFVIETETPATSDGVRVGECRIARSSLGRFPYPRYLISSTGSFDFAGHNHLSISHCLPAPIV